MEGKNFSVVTSVAGDLQKAEIWADTYKFTQEKKVSRARFVNWVSMTIALWLHTSVSTPGRTHFFARFVKKSFSPNMYLWSTWKFTLARNGLVAHFVVKDLQQETIWYDIWDTTDKSRSCHVCHKTFRHVYYLKKHKCVDKSSKNKWSCRDACRRSFSHQIEILRAGHDQTLICWKLWRTTK